MTPDSVLRLAMFSVEGWLRRLLAVFYNLHAKYCFSTTLMSLFWISRQMRRSLSILVLTFSSIWSTLSAISCLHLAVLCAVPSLFLCFSLHPFPICLLVYSSDRIFLAVFSGKHGLGILHIINYIWKLPKIHWKWILAWNNRGLWMYK